MNLVIRTLDSPSYTKNTDGTVTFDYMLAKSYSFNCPCYARLVQLHGISKKVFVHVGFIKPQDVGGKPQKIIGSNFTDSLDPWIPLENSYIPANGSITLSSVDGTPIKQRNKITVWIEVSEQKV